MTRRGRRAFITATLGLAGLGVLASIVTILALLPAGQIPTPVDSRPAPLGLPAATGEHDAHFAGGVVVVPGEHASTSGPGTSAEPSLIDAASAPSTSTKRGPESLGDPRGPVQPDAVTGGAAPGGCLPQYGSTGQCLPSVPPSMSGHVAAMVDAGLDPGAMDHDWGCPEVRFHFPAGLAVRVSGVDPQGLDSNGDGIACGPGDAVG